MKMMFIGQQTPVVRSNRRSNVVSKAGSKANLKNANSVLAVGDSIKLGSGKLVVKTQL